MDAMYEEYRTALLKYHNRHEMLAAMHEVHGELDNATFWELFRSVWTSLNTYFNASVEIRNMLTEERLNSPARAVVMSHDEKAWLRRAYHREKPIKVYRGGSVHNHTGFSWTTKRAEAERHARLSGRKDASITIGRVPPWHVVLNIRNGQELVLLPDLVEVEKIDDYPGLAGDDLERRQVEIMAQARGPHAVLGMTQPEYFVDALVKGRLKDKGMLLDFFRESLAHVEPLGFKTRAQTLRECIEAVEAMDGIRSA